MLGGGITQAMKEMGNDYTKYPRLVFLVAATLLLVQGSIARAGSGQVLVSSIDNGQAQCRCSGYFSNYRSGGYSGIPASSTATSSSADCLVYTADASGDLERYQGSDSDMGFHSRSTHSFSRGDGASIIFNDY
jgi:hypothetical protein